jgi:tetratricopeptide (TPR) repeat protein
LCRHALLINDMKKILATLFLSLVSLSVVACYNQIGVIPGITYPNKLNGWELWKPDIDEAALHRYISESETNCGSDVICSDLVIAYLYTGEFEKALELSERLVKKFPRKYEVVMTHAAALELNGKFREALTFIRKGMAIDPHSHKDSEWIHVKILEACIAGGRPASILGFDFGKGNEPDTPKGIANVRQMVDQIHFQLTERYHFIPKIDPQFGALLHDYANLLYLSNFKTISRDYYDLALTYGFDPEIKPNNASLPQLKKEIAAPEPREPAEAKKAQPESPTSTLKVLLVFLSVVVLTVLAHLWYTTRNRP